MRTYKGGSLDWLGMDDGTRKIPDNIPNERFDHRSPLLGATAEERQARQREMIAALANVWTPYTTKAPINQSYGLSLGNKIPVGDDRFVGWLLGGNYGAKWSSNEDFVGQVGLNTAGPDTQVVYSDKYTSEVGTETVQWGLLGTTSFQDGDRHKVRLNFMMNRDWEDEVGRVYGFREADADTSLVYEIATAQQTLLNGQLEGSHKLASDGTRLTWMAAMTGASRWEPDRRVSKYYKDSPDDPAYNPEFPFVALPTLGLRDRYWFDLREQGRGGKVDLEKPVEWAVFQEGSKLKGGLFAFGKGRDFDVRRITYVTGTLMGASDLRHGSYEGIFGAFNGAADSGYITNGDENEKDDYTVEDFQWAAHAQADWVISESWRAVLGARFIHARVEGKAHAQDGSMSPPEDSVKICDATGRCTLPFGYEKSALLPALSLVYSLTPDQNLRASWTRTFSFPEYREMAPLLFFSYQEALETYGNVRLKPTDIQNYDLRWEWFISGSELLAVSGFYKLFKDPVETRITQISSNNRALFENVPRADLYGFETELRLGLERAHDALSDFEVIGNFTWIHSEVDGARKRPMQGQSPYLVNAILLFEPFQERTQMSLLYNRVDRRLAKVGVYPFPDVYEEARETVEFAYTQKLGAHWKAKFTARNLTDAVAEQTQGGLVVKRSRPGRAFSLGVSYAF
jgi:TonB-dependent receptor